MNVPARAAPSHPDSAVISGHRRPGLVTEPSQRRVPHHRNYPVRLVKRPGLGIGA